MAALALLLGWSNASAVTGSELTATMNDVFLYNVGAGNYLSAGDWWGTHATIRSAGMDLNLTKVNEGVYTIDTRQGNRYLNGEWMDGASCNFTFTEVDAENHYYTISYESDGTKYLYYADETVGSGTSADNNNYYWQVVTRANFLSSLAGATEANPKDATGAIYNAGFFCLDYATAKDTDFPETRSWQGTKLTDTWGYRNNEKGVSSSNYCVEQYGKEFDNYQILTGMPNGAYVVKNQGFYKGSNPGYLYANDKQIALTKIEAAPAAPDGYTGNDLQKASWEFGKNDGCHNTVPKVIVTDGTLRIGAKSDNGGGTWYCFDNFTLSYLGTPSATNGIDMTEYITNPSFSSAYTTGWTLDGTAPNDYNSTYGTYEAYHRVGGLHQALTGLPNGVYKVTMQAAVRVDGGATGSFNLFATTSNGTTKSPATVAAHTNFGTMAETMSNDPSFARIETYAIVTDGNLTIGHYESNNSTWPVFDNYTLTYYGAGSDAYALAMASEAAKAESSITAMTDGSMKTAMNAAYTTKSSEPTLANIQWMTFVSTSKSELIEASNLGIAADAVAAVAYTETVSGSHTTYTDAISAFQSSVTSATTTDAINTAITTLRSAIKTYIAGAKPTNEGDYFDITCLMVNPSFDNNNASGWSGDTPGFQSYNNAEFFNKNFDFYQNLTGLANGSYRLTVQAYCRPGDNGNETSGAYYDYTQGINNITAELYVNSDASTIGNIYSYKSNTTAAKVVGNDFHCNISLDDYWVPNNMQGASLYFADGAYVTEVAALVTDGNLKIGFREESKKTNQWVIFDNFKLYYYGSSKLIYYKQYLPQLRTEVSADLSNGAYANVLVSSEDETLDAALVADPASETEEAYETVINNLRTAQKNFRAAKSSYDAMVAAKSYSALTKVSANIGTGVFQYNESTNNSLWVAYETAKGNVDSYTFTTSSTAAGAQSLVDALDVAINNYNNQSLNAPDPSKRYWVTMHDDGQKWDGYAITFIAGGRTGEGDYGLKYLAPSNANLNQAIKFTAVAGETNTYKVSGIKVADGGEQYITTLAVYDNEDADKNIKLRTTDDVSKAMWVKIEATSTSGQFQMRNVTANAIIAHNGNDNNDMFTRNSANFTIAEASQATVDVAINGALKYATRIFPFFAPTLPDGVKAYSCSTTAGNVLTLTEDASPAANTPYILYAEDNINQNLSGWGTATATTYTVGLLTGVYGNTPAPVGSYVLQNNGKFGFYLVADGQEPTVPAYRCYLTKQAEARAAYFFNDDSTTKIKAVEALTSGKARIFNASGAQIPALQKGVNILLMEDGTTQKIVVK